MPSHRHAAIVRTYALSAGPSSGHGLFCCAAGAVSFLAAVLLDKLVAIASVGLDSRVRDMVRRVTGWAAPRAAACCSRPSRC